MSLTAIILLAIALSIDACVVSFTYGLVLTDNKFKNAFSLAVFTGIAQGIMPLIGFFATQSVYKYIEPISKFLVFAIFIYLGIKFIQEAFEHDKEIPLCLDLKCLLLVAAATSIDAFGAGINLMLTHTKILPSALLIACTTFIFVFFGYFSGCCMKKISTKFLETIGGLILILLAIQSLF